MIADQGWPSSGPLSAVMLACGMAGAAITVRWIWSLGELRKLDGEEDKLEDMQKCWWGPHSIVVVYMWKNVVDVEHWWKNFTSTFLLLPIPDSMPFIQLVSGDHCVSKNTWLSFQSSNIYILIMLEPCQAKQWPWAYWGSLTVLGGLMVDCDVLHIALDWFNNWDPPNCLFPHSMPQIVGLIRCDGGRTQRAAKTSRRLRGKQQTLLLNGFDADKPSCEV